MKKKLVSNKELLKRIKNNKLEVKRILELVSHRKKNLIKTKVIKFLWISFSSY